jgi:hypothetical protein
MDRTRQTDSARSNRLPPRRMIVRAPSGSQSTGDSGEEDFFHRCFSSPCRGAETLCGQERCPRLRTAVWYDPFPPPPGVHFSRGESVGSHAGECE